MQVKFLRSFQFKSWADPQTVFRLAPSPQKEQFFRDFRFKRRFKRYWIDFEKNSKNLSKIPKFLKSFVRCVRLYKPPWRPRGREKKWSKKRSSTCSKPRRSRKVVDSLKTFSMHEHYFIFSFSKVERASIFGHFWGKFTAQQCAFSARTS